MAWKDDMFALKNAGFSDEEIAAEGQRQRDELAAGGFSEQEINGHFVVKEPDLTPIKNLLEANLNMKAEEYRQLAAEGKQVPEVADTFLEALDAGFQQSSGVMVTKALQGKRVTPDMLLPEDAETFYRIASQVGTIVGDIPAMTAGSLAGAFAGASLGSSVPVVGTAAGALVGAGAGGNALPTAMRQVLVEYYEKGEIQDFKDFWSRTSAVFLNTSKDALIGGATAGVGGKVLSSASKIASPAAARVASVSSEIATMVTLGKGMEGEVPSAQDFIDATITVGGLNFAAHTATKMRQIYAKTGIKPEQVMQDAQVDPVLKQELLTHGDELPKVYQSMVEPTKTVEGKPAVTPEPKTLEPATAQDKILYKIGEKAPKEGEKFFDFEEFYGRRVDRFNPVKNAAEILAKGEKLESAENPYDLARMASDAQAKATHFLGTAKNPTGGGVLDYKTLAKTGKSFQEIIQPHRQEMDGLTAYLVSKRVVELDGRGINSGFDVEAAKQVVAEGSTKFEKAAGELVEFQNGALKYLKDSGILSEKAFAAMKESNKSYISFKRIVEGETVGGKGTAKNPVKRIKGSDADIQNPFQSMVENLELYLSLAEKNRAKVSLVELVEKSGDTEIIKKVNQPMKPVEVKAEEIKSALQKQGIDADPEPFTIFRRMDKDLRPNEFEVFRNGKREVYEATPEIAESFKLLDGNFQAQSLLIKMARGVSTAKRFAVSILPDFQLRNLIRDTITSKVFSQSGNVKITDLVVAMGDLYKKNDHYYNWLKAGGANGAFLKITDNYLNNDIYNLDQQVGFLDKTWNIIKTPVQFAEAAAQLTENATRLAEFKRVTKGATEGPAIFKGGMASREITIDFQRMGSKMAAWNGITAFMNAQIQGVDRTARAIKADPVGVGSKGLALTAVSALLWVVNKDDERFKELPQWQKDLFWIIPIDYWADEEVPGEAQTLAQSAPHMVREGNNGRYQINKGPILRVPKPQELGLIFATIPERVMDAFNEQDPEAFSGLAETVFETFTPNFIPDALAPIAEQAVNKSFFTKNELVSSYLEKQLPQYRYNEYTTETAKQLGKMIGYVPYLRDVGSKEAPLASPSVIENYVSSWTGNLGKYALQLADKGLQAAGVVSVPEKPAWQLGEIPVIKAFTVKYPASNSESIQKFFQDYEKNEQVLSTIKTLTKAGQVDEAQSVMANYQDRMVSLGGFADALKAQSKMIRMIQANPEMRADEKRQLIDGVYYQMIEIAKQGRLLNKEAKEIAQSLDNKGEQ